MKNLGILLSGRGSNFVAIADNVAAGRIPNARIAVVISNKADAGGVAVAERADIPTKVIPHKNYTSREDSSTKSGKLSPFPLHTHPKLYLLCCGRNLGAAAHDVSYQIIILSFADFHS